MQSLGSIAEIYDNLVSQCLEMYAAGETMQIAEMAMRLMDDACVPMHSAFHHFIVPAVLLIASMKAQGAPLADFQANLNEALVRAKNVSGGFCGNYGACGAAVGVGIFMSVFTDTTPMSVQTWGWANAVTAQCLQEIAQYQGPRCCKRVVFLALRTVVSCIKEKLDITLSPVEQVHCKYFERNKECKKREFGLGR